jgi:hypothetical protein
VRNRFFSLAAIAAKRNSTKRITKEKSSKKLFQKGSFRGKPFLEKVFLGFWFLLLVPSRKSRYATQAANDHEPASKYPLHRRSAVGD